MSNLWCVGWRVNGSMLGEDSKIKMQSKVKPGQLAISKEGAPIQNTPEPQSALIWPRHLGAVKSYESADNILRKAVTPNVETTALGGFSETANTLGEPLSMVSMVVPKVTFI